MTGHRRFHIPSGAAGARVPACGGRFARVAVLFAVLTAPACGGPFSTLTPAGRDAELLNELFQWMALGALVVWVLVVALAFYATRRSRESHSERTAAILIIGGGVILPTIVLTVLLLYGLSIMPRVLAPPPGAAPFIEVSGEQWWWRVRYLGGDGPAVELANELRLPVGRRVEIRLLSPDVIHSFWVPSLAGKIDMVPGRQNRIALEPTRLGTFRGACAEYCGTSHALMNFDVVVVEPAEFDRWLANQARPAAALNDPGLDAFLSNGCGACHTVRGTSAAGRLGPDLTHVGSRLRIGAGVLPNGPEEVFRFIGETGAIKPGVHMPAFEMLAAEERRAMAQWLKRLE